MIKVIKINKIKTIAFLFISFLFFSCGTDKPERVDNPNSKEYQDILVDQELKEETKIKENKVKERRIFSRFTDNIVKGGGPEVLSERINFDKNGNKTEQFRYTSDGLHTQWLFEYDEYGNNKSIETYDGFQQLIEKNFYDYASNGALKQKWEEIKGKKYFSEYSYDEEYNLTKIHYLDDNRRLYSTAIYKYENDLLDSVQFYKNNIITKFYTFEYDSLNRPITIINAAENRLVNKITIEYDSSGNIINRRDKVADWRYVYNDSGDIIEEQQFNASGDYQGRSTFKYNNKTNLLEEKVRYDGLDKDALIIRYEYEFY